MSEPSGAAYARIAAELSRRIAVGDLSPGDRVPSTRRVAEEFDVALATAAKALDALRREGLIVTRPRSGSVVAAPNRARAPGTAAAELDRARVLAEATAIADAEGLQAVSMRAVAGRCGVAPMSLYRHVDSKDELVLLMSDAAYGEVDLDVGGGGWRADTERLARALWRLHRDHPWLGQINPLTRPLPVPNLMAVGDRILGALDGLGLPPKLRFDVHVLLYGHIVGLAANFEREDAAVSETGLSAEEWTDLQYVPTFHAGRSAVDLPHFSALFGPAGALDEGYDMDLDELFELGLRLLLDGVERLAAR